MVAFSWGGGRWGEVGGGGGNCGVCRAHVRPRGEAKPGNKPVFLNVYGAQE
jgi:hypothetical protein